MNHVQILHAGEVQNLHSSGVQILHAQTPAGKDFRQAGVRKLPPGLEANIALWRAGNIFTQACMQILHAGENPFTILRIAIEIYCYFLIIPPLVLWFNYARINSPERSNSLLFRGHTKQLFWVGFLFFSSQVHCHRCASAFMFWQERLKSCTLDLGWDCFPWQSHPV